MKDTARRIVRFGIQNYIRNGWLSLAATIMMTMTLFVVSVFALQTYVIKTTIGSIQEKLDMAIYLTDTPSEEEVAKFLSDIKNYPEIREVAYLNKDQVIQEWNRLSVDQKIKSQVNAENNPLPRTVKLKAHNPESLDAVAERINDSNFSKQNYIRNISYRNNRPIIQQLIERSKKIKQSGLIVSILFGIIAVTFIYNTIRIIVRFREDEISIMKLVGATDSFVRGPFLVEGMLYGVLAGLLTVAALFFYLQNGLSESVTSIVNPDTLIAGQVFTIYKTNLFLITITLVGSAVVLSLICSWLSLRHHLKR
jgi:cell division transport system permease protein